MSRSGRVLGDLIDQIPDAVFVCEPDGRIVDANTAACRILELDRNRVLQTSLLDLDISVDVHDFWRHLALADKCQPVVVNRHYLRGDGVTIPVEARFSKLGNDADAKLLVFVRDQSAAIEAASKLRESQERFSNCFEHAAIGMALVRPDGRWLLVNRSLCQILGYEEAQLLSSDSQSITHPDDLEVNLAARRRLLAGAINEYHLETRFFRPSGEIVWASLNASLIRGENNKPLYFLSQIQDITENKRLLETLRANEEEFTAIFEYSGVGKAQIDLRTGRVMRPNPRWLEIVGYGDDEIQKFSFTDLTHPDDMAEVAAGLRKVRDGLTPQCSIETRCLRKDGKTIWALLNLVGLSSALGGCTRAVATVQDITDTKMEQRLESDRSAILELVTRDSPIKLILEEIARAVETQLEAPTAVFVVQDGVLNIHGPQLPRNFIEQLQSTAFSVAPALAASAWEQPGHLGITSIQTHPAWQPLRSAAAQAGFDRCWTVVINSDETVSVSGLICAFPTGQQPPSDRAENVLHRCAELSSICISHHTTTRQLAHLVRHDLLTGLPNRILFQDRLQQALSMAHRSGKSVGLLAIDVDHFKLINDTYGHDAGDAALQQFAQRIRRQLRQTDTVARIGGDEFVAVLPELNDPSGAALVARKIIESLAEPFRLAGQLVAVSGSIGVAVYPADAKDAQELLRAADAQLYETKRSGRNGFSAIAKSA